MLIGITVKKYYFCSINDQEDLKPLTMTRLQQLFLKIQEISKDNYHIPIDDIVREIGWSSADVSSHVEMLSHLEFIYFTDRNKKSIRITETGKRVTGC